MEHKKNYLFKSIFIKFVLAFIFVGLFPLMTIGYYFFEQLPKDMEKDLISNYNQMLLFTSKNIEMKIGEYNQISQLVYNYQSGKYDSISQIFKENEYQLMEDFLKHAVYSDRYIESAFFLNDKWEIYSHYTQNSYPLDFDFELDHLPKTDQIKKHKRDLSILPAHGEDYYFRSETQVIGFVRNYLDIHLLPDVEKVIALFWIEVNTAFIKNIFDPISLGKESQIIIMDSLGNTIYQSSETERGFSTGEIHKQVKGPSETNTAGYLTGKRGYLFYRNVAGSDWIIVFEIPHSDIYLLVNENKKLGLIVIVFLLLSLLSLALAFSKKLFQPIKNIMAQMKRVEAGDLNSEVTVKTHDEIFLLAQAFNKMVKELKIHVDEAYVAQIKQKEAELNAIKTQIRPHYLYNTLEIIRMSALEENAVNTQKMIFSLSEQLKYLIGYSEKYVALRQELEMIKNYFKILHFRYEQRIRLEIDIPPDFYDYQVLKLMIQPLVENAVTHGLKPKKGRGTVKISASVKDGILQIDIIDDGVGMSIKRLSEVQSNMSKDQPEESIGLNNVKNRIELAYGPAYGIEIVSKINMGTLMSIRVPAEKEGR